MNNNALLQHKHDDHYDKCQDLIIFNKKIADKYGTILGLLSLVKTTAFEKLPQIYHTYNYNSKLEDDVFRNLRNKGGFGESFSELVARLLNNLEKEEEETINN